MPNARTLPAIGPDSPFDPFDPRAHQFTGGTRRYGVLCVQRDTMNPRYFVGIWADPNGTTYSGTEGECSRQYFRTVRQAVQVLAERYGIDPGIVGCVRGVSLQAYIQTVERATRLQYPSGVPVFDNVSEV